MRLRRDRPPEILRIVRVDEDDIDTPVPQRDVELGIGAAIKRVGGDDLVAGAEQCRECNELRGLAGRDRQSADAAFERGHPLFKRSVGRDS